mgnify:CR=1 FL=1
MDALCACLSGCRSFVGRNPDGTAIVQTQGVTVTGAALLNPTTVEVLFSDGQRMTLDFYGETLSACSRIRWGNYP